MNIKKQLLLLSLGLAIGAYAQDAAAPAPAVPAPAAPAADSATAVVNEQAAAVAEAPADSAKADAGTAQAVTDTTAATEAQPAADTTAAAEVPQAASDTTAAADTTAANDSTAQAAPEQEFDPNAKLPEAEEDVAAQEPAADSAAVAAPAASDSAATAEAAQIAAADSAAQAPATPAEPAPKHPMDILHGNAYNIVANEAAAATVNGNLAMPHKMLGSKFAYFEPIDGEGVVSFGETNSYFFAFDNSQNLGLLTAGMAFGRFGFSVETAVGKNWDNVEATGVEQTINTTAGGTLYGGTFSAKLGNFDVGVHGRYVHPDDIAYISNNGNEVETTSWDAFGKLTVSKANNPKFAWTAAVTFLRHDGSTETIDRTTTFSEGKTYLVTHRVKSTDTTARIEAAPEFNFGSNVLQSERARIFIGLNTFVPVIFFDEIENIRDKDFTVAAYTSPNILGEVALGSHLIAFGSADYTWKLMSFRQFELNDIDIKSKAIQSGTTNVNLGARFQYEQAALEMVFTKQFLENPFGSFSDHNNIGVSIGAFIMF
ncbi:MAG: hypothetical protein MJY99_06975 [Fibrobacter sp.]|nr:hypothetical protein [Fibrobacter sp.]